MGARRPMRPCGRATRPSTPRATLPSRKSTRTRRWRRRACALLGIPPRADLSFLILLGRTKVRLKPLLLELHPSSSDELVKCPFSELRFRDDTLAPSDSIKSNLQGYNSTSPAQAGSTVQHPRSASKRK